MKTLIVPGYMSSLEGHWQHYLLEQIPGSITVHLERWDNPERESWVENLSKAINEIDEPVYLVAHSMGSVTIAAMAEDGKVPNNVAGALLVTPADSENQYIPPEIIGFDPMPSNTIPFPTLLIGSESDPYMSYERADHFSKLWGSDIQNYGKVGHINTASGFGKWDEVVDIIMSHINEIKTK